MKFRANGGPDEQVWECQECGREREKHKAGASEGARAYMRCGSCGGRQFFECKEA